MEFLYFSVGAGAFAIGLSQISSFFSKILSPYGLMVLSQKIKLKPLKCRKFFAKDLIIIISD